MIVFLKNQLIAAYGKASWGYLQVLLTNNINRFELGFCEADVFFAASSEYLDVDYYHL